MKHIIWLFCLSFIIHGCAETSNPEDRSASLNNACGSPTISYDKSQLYPGPGSLRRPEDGRQLADGRIVVADEYSGLWLIESEGHGRPFGKFAEAGYKHNPPENIGGPNGMFLEKDGQHLLLADIYTGKIYRINVKTEDVEVIYDHKYGVNSVFRDRKGNIWFTQSTKNEEGHGFDGLLGDIDHPAPTGAVYVLQSDDGKLRDSAQIVIAGLYFANGLTMDNEEKYMYIAETAMDRILRFRAVPESGILIGGEVFSRITTPDNLVMDSHNRLFVASPIENSVYAIDLLYRSTHIAFEARSAANSQYRNKWMLRTRMCEPVADLFTPDMTRPLSGLLTGMFFSNDEKTIFITGTGTSILKCKMP